MLEEMSEEMGRLERLAKSGDIAALYLLNSYRVRRDLPTYSPFLVLGPRRLILSGKAYAQGDILLTENSDDLSLRHAVLSGLLYPIPTGVEQW